MGDILSQEEIDALLKGLTSGSLEAVKEERREGGRLKVYDFRRPEKFSKDQIRTFHMIFSALARLASTNLAAFLRSRCQVELVSTDQLTYDEFVRSVPNPTFVCIFSLLPLEGRCVLQMNLDMVFPMLDRLLGGLGNAVFNPRPLTEIENRIMTEVTERIMSALKESWTNIQQVEPRIEALESNLEFVQVVSGNDMVILFTFSVEVGEREGMMTICIPYLVVEPITQKLSASLWFAGRRSTDSQIQEKVKKRINQVRLPVTVELGKASITLKELLNLEIGDVVVLDKRVGEPLDVLVGEKTKMKGMPGRVNRRLAIKITEVEEER
ncbi:MAG: flagellar motor switch protein FliM [Candidatus Atribacteria bacterium]|nr:flagellar motor switch protein FliM [Candidatus Atribacteria bacterium]